MEATEWWSSLTARGRVWAAGFTVGLVGFTLGYFGPLFMRPEANLGPLLGIFVTGPGGFLLGVAFGFVCGFFHTSTRLFTVLLLSIAISVAVVTIWLSGQ